MRIVISLFILSIFFTPTKAQNPEKPKLITGPFVGAVTKNTAKIWIAYKGDGQNMLTLIDTLENTIHIPTGFDKINDEKGNVALTMTFTDLKPEHVYKVDINRDAIIHPKCIFTTQADSAVKDFDFLIGSCALINTDASSFMFPGASIHIFDVMRKRKSDFMLWMGDNVYYFSKHYNSFQGMFTRNLKIRDYYLQVRYFLAAQPNYAIWDDHDYGWNDADRKFPLRDTALTVFKAFWPNPYPTEDSLKGNFFTFRYYDAEFFMTDDRYYRDPEGDTAGAFMGKEQVEWLKDKLLKSDATFKFIGVGSQVLNDSYYGESFAKYPVERNNLLDFIADNNIKGVVFLSGDKHYSEISKRDWKGYTMYDFTCSPLTSPVVNMRHLGGFHNTYSVPETVLYKKNFGKVSISGPAEDRVCKMEVFGIGGQKKWEYILRASDLGKK